MKINFFRLLIFFGILVIIIVVVTLSLILTQRSDNTNLFPPHPKITKHNSKTQKVLVVSPVEDSDRAVELWTNNYNVLQRWPNVFYIHFVHFDGKNKHWKEKFIPYNNVQHTLHTGCKVSIWKLFDSRVVDGYEYIWLLDGDIGLEYFNWNKYKTYLHPTDLMSQPAVRPYKKFHRSSDHIYLRWRKNKTITRVKRIEVMCPIIKTILWPLIYSKLQETDVRSDWEIEHFWKKYANTCKGRKYLVVHVSPVVHLNWKSINKKINKNNCLRKYIKSKDPKTLQKHLQTLKQYCQSL